MMSLCDPKMVGTLPPSDIFLKPLSTSHVLSNYLRIILRQRADMVFGLERSKVEVHAHLLIRVILCP